MYMKALVKKLLLSLFIPLLVGSNTYSAPVYSVTRQQNSVSEAIQKLTGTFFSSSAPDSDKKIETVVKAIIVAFSIDEIAHIFDVVVDKTSALATAKEIRCRPLLEVYLDAIATHNRTDAALIKKIALLTIKKQFSAFIFWQVKGWLPAQPDAEIEKHLCSISNDDFDGLLKIIIYYDHTGSTSVYIEKTPSINHLIHNISILLSRYTMYGFDNPAIQKMIMAAINKEKELIAQGYVPFVHGRDRIHNFPTQLYMFLDALKNGKNPHNFIPTHIKKQEVDLPAEVAIRKLLITEGNPFTFESSTHAERVRRRRKLLFLNHFIFGNCKYGGDSSYYYMYSNFNVGNIGTVHITAKQVFQMFDMDYAPYAEKLGELEKEFYAVSSFGQMLQIGITPEKVKQCVYPTLYEGKKDSIKLSDTTSSDDIETILNHLKTDPIDDLHFALVNTCDTYGGLNPHGMKISVLDAADYDPESLAKKIACEKKRNELFAHIERDYKTAKA